MTQYRQTDTGDLFDEDEIESYFYDVTAELPQERRDEVSFEKWLEAMIDWSRFEIADEDDDADVR